MKLLQAGWRLEIFSTYEGSELPTRRRKVNLSAVSEEAFLMNEGDHLVLSLAD